MNIFYIIFKYKLNGIKAYIKLLLGQIEFMKLKDDSFILVCYKNFNPYFKLRKGTSDHSTFRQIFIEHEYDIPLNFKPKTIIDAGANIGLAAIYFSRAYPESIIYSIEPEGSNVDLLRENVARYSNVVIYQQALHHSANINIDVMDESKGKYGFVTKESDNTVDCENTIESVKSLSIQSLMELHDIKVIDILKIDIEGAERDIFSKGYEVWLPKTRCLIIEFHDRWYPDCESTVFAAVKQYDFSFYIKGENHVFINNAI